MAEWTIAAVLKTVELLQVPGVRIPFSPQVMKFDDLTVVPIKTLVATQRMILIKFGYAISFMGDEQGFTSGDGTNTFEIQVFKHNLKLDKDIDFLNSGINPDVIDFKHPVFTMESVPRTEIDDFFEVFTI